MNSFFQIVLSKTVTYVANSAKNVAYTICTGHSTASYLWYNQMLEQNKQISYYRTAKLIPLIFLPSTRTALSTARTAPIDIPFKAAASKCRSQEALISQLRCLSWLLSLRSGLCEAQNIRSNK